MIKGEIQDPPDRTRDQQCRTFYSDRQDQARSIGDQNDIRVPETLNEIGFEGLFLSNGDGTPRKSKRGRWAGYLRRGDSYRRTLDIPAYLKGPLASDNEGNRTSMPYLHNKSQGVSSMSRDTRCLITSASIKGVLTSELVLIQYNLVNDHFVHDHQFHLDSYVPKPFLGEVNEVLMFPLVENGLRYPNGHFLEDAHLPRSIN
jgi:hypothetical protein